MRPEKSHFVLLTLFEKTSEACLFFWDCIHRWPFWKTWMILDVLQLKQYDNYGKHQPEQFGKSNNYISWLLRGRAGVMVGVANWVRPQKVKHGQIMKSAWIRFFPLFCVMSERGEIPESHVLYITNGHSHCEFTEKFLNASYDWQVRLFVTVVRLA